MQRFVYFCSVHMLVFCRVAAMPAAAATQPNKGSAIVFQVPDHAARPLTHSRALGSARFASYIRHCSQSIRSYQSSIAPDPEAPRSPTNRAPSSSNARTTPHGRLRIPEPSRPPPATPNRPTPEPPTPEPPGPRFRGDATSRMFSMDASIASVAALLLLPRESAPIVGSSPGPCTGLGALCH